MSWRRFTLLVRCLSGESATIAHLSSEQYIGSGAKRERVNVIETPEAAQRAFVSMFGP